MSRTTTRISSHFFSHERRITKPENVEENLKEENEVMDKEVKDKDAEIELMAKEFGLKGGSTSGGGVEEMVGTDFVREH